MREKKSTKEQLEQHREQCRAVFGRLREQEKRHVAGLLALLVGHGGVEWVADAAGLQRSCVSRGKAEVESELKGRPVDRQRLPGGGRKPIEKKVPKSSKPSKRSSPKKPEERRRDDENSSD
jgi:hypothetical protein